MKWNATLFLAAALFAVPALAQLPPSAYVVTSAQMPYQPLTGGTVVTWNNSSLDDAHGSIPLGFTFPFYSQSVTTVGVNTNGLILMDPTVCTSGCYSNVSIPTTGTPNGFIAPWWDDLKPSPSGQARWVKPSPSQIIIEFSDWAYLSNSSTPTFSFQVKLDASGLIQIHYGSHGTVTRTGVTAGWEDAAGANGGGVIACGGTAGCSNNDWPTNTLFTIGQPTVPELFVSSVAIGNIVKSGSNLTLDVTPTFQNIGTQPANNFHWKAYLSTDKTLSAGDQLIHDSSVAGSDVSVAASSTTTVTVNASATGVTTGNYYVLVEADTTGAVAELSEVNNVGTTANHFTYGIDLVATAVSGPAQTGPGNNITVNASWFNQGTDPAPTPGNVVQYRILLSTDKTLDSNDFVAHTGTEVVTGGTTFNNKPISFQVPQNVPGGDYYFGLLVDSDDKVVEAPGNNVVFAGSLTKVFQADLEPSSVDLIDPYTRTPVREGLLNDTGRVRVTLKNIGGADAKNFKIGVVLSPDSNLSLLNDPVIHDEPVTLVSAGATTTVEFNFQFPANMPNGTPYKTGGYYIFVILDSFSEVTELNESNNTLPIATNGAVDQIFLRSPAADYAVVNLQAPANAAVGEIVPVSRLFRNVGNMPGKTVTYRYVISANAIIDAGDPALLILGEGGQTVDSAQITLAADGSDSRTELVRLPSTLQPGRWYIGVILDVTNADEELDETNNAYAAPSSTQVVASSLVIAQQQLPDAVEDLPYSFKLAASGAEGAVTWSVLEGAPPAGMTLSESGHLSGVPANSAVSTFLVQAATAERATSAWLVLRVLPGAGQLVITTENLPPVINNPQKPYEAQLAAAGGAKGYQWTLISGTLPNGLTLSSSGKISGAVRSGVPNAETTLVVEVADALGSRARATLKIRVIEASALFISTMSLPDGMVNADYLTDLAAKNADGSNVAAPLTWEVVAGRLPEGLALSAAGSATGLLSGKPLTSGTFAFTLQVTDAKGRIDTTDFIFNIHPAVVKITATGIPGELHPGDAVNMQVTTGNAASVFRLYSGTLPPGVTVDAAGVIAGTIEADGSLGTWNFVVEAQTPGAGASLAAFSIDVVPAPVAQGCAAAPSSSGALTALIALAGLMLIMRRRSA